MRSSSAKLRAIFRSYGVLLDGAVLATLPYGFQAKSSSHPAGCSNNTPALSMLLGGPLDRNARHSVEKASASFLGPSATRVFSRQDHRPVRLQSERMQRGMQCRACSSVLGKCRMRPSTCKLLPPCAPTAAHCVGENNGWSSVSVMTAVSGTTT